MINNDPAGPPQRSNGLWIAVAVGAAFAACLALVIVGVLAAGGYLYFARSAQPAPLATVPASGTASVTAASLALVTPLPYAHGKSLGPTDATVVIQEFGDFQCPPCRRFHDTIQPKLVDAYIATGQARFEFHHYIVINLNTGGSESRRAAEASECANAQGLFWEYAGVVFDNQNGEGKGAFDDAHLLQFADQIGLDPAAFGPCYSSRQYANDVRQDETLARSLSVNSTPSVFVDGQKVTDPFNYDEIVGLVDAALGK